MDRFKNRPGCALNHPAPSKYSGVEEQCKIITNLSFAKLYLFPFKPIHLKLRGAKYLGLFWERNLGGYLLTRP